MSLMTSWKSYRRNRRIRRHYGCTHPTHADVVGGSVSIRVDPGDERARKILLLDSIRGRDRANQAFWFLMLRELGPSVCVDIGLNYGECLLAGRIPAGASGYGFEANPRLKSFVDESQAEHPDRDRLNIVFSPVADKSGQAVQLRIDPKWSGGTHVAAAGQQEGNYEVVIDATTVTVDESIPRPTKSDRLLFKIDVEGFEPAALQGMAETFAGSGETVGFMEFSTDIMIGRGVDLDAYWQFLSSRFETYFCTARGEAFSIKADCWDEANQTIRNRHGDLIVTANIDDEEKNRLLACWRSLR